MTAHTLIWLYSLLFDREGRAMQWAGRFWSSSLFVAVPGWKLKIEGAENLDPQQPYVVVINHRSMLDIPVMFNIPYMFKWVSKREVYRIPVFGWVLWERGDIAINRGNATSTKEMMEKGKAYLAKGVSVNMFPEGTRSKDGEIHRYKDGAFYLAHDAGVAILPCVMDGTDRLFDGWKIARCTVRLRVLPPIPAEEVVVSEPKVLSKRVQAMAVEAMAEIKAEK
ncbi:MAG: 1-acyl-sn-glycerol-3-phosphate acyltransferase [Tidjanibacter sp.]|nr:1-acyl-sn-glycerol-3-phosphate acyltransferase [Tidjanibacter sp.]